MDIDTSTLVNKWKKLLIFEDDNILPVSPLNYESCAREMEETERSFDEVYFKHTQQWSHLRWHINSLTMLDMVAPPDSIIMHEFYRSPTVPAVTEVRRSWSPKYNGVLLNKKPVLKKSGIIEFVETERQVLS